MLKGKYRGTDCAAFGQRLRYSEGPVPVNIGSLTKDGEGEFVTLDLPEGMEAMRERASPFAWLRDR